MQQEIRVLGKTTQYELRRSKRAKRVRVTVCHDGSVVVTVPQRVNLAVAERFVHEKSDWIKKKIEYFRQRPPHQPVRRDPDEYRRHKDRALAFVTERIEFFNLFYAFKYNKITIRNQKTRWGSCSNKGNFNFNYRILFLPRRAADYIIVNELCHLKQMNHSAKFWELVGQTIPNHREIRKELNESGLGLG